METSSCTVGGPAPYTVVGEIKPGQSVCRPQRGTGVIPDMDDPCWSKPYPILPCGGMTYGHDGEVLHFSPIVPNRSAAAFIYGIMTWAFYVAKGAFVFSIENTVHPNRPWLNIITTDPDDWNGLDAVYQRLISAGTDNLDQAVEDLCEEVRP